MERLPSAEMREEGKRLNLKDQLLGFPPTAPPRQQDSSLTLLPAFSVPSVLTKASAVDGRLALCLLLRWLLGRVRVGMVLMRVVASMLQWRGMHGHHRRGAIAFSSGLFSPWGSTTIRAWGVQWRGTPYS